MDKIYLQDYERRGNVGICFYGSDDADENTYEKRIVFYRAKVRQRPWREAMIENITLLRLGAFDNCPSNCQCSTCNGIDNETVLN